jgi:hypothetical protein
MQIMDRAFDVSKAQARVASEASHAVSACVGAMLEASAAFAKSSAERNVALATTMISAKSPESAAEIHGAFMRESLRAASMMVARIADACNVAAKQCNALAVQAMESAAALGAAVTTSH